MQPLMSFYAFIALAESLNANIFWVGQKNGMGSKKNCPCIEMIPFEKDFRDLIFPDFSLCYDDLKIIADHFRGIEKTTALIFKSPHPCKKALKLFLRKKFHICILPRNCKIEFS